MGSNVLFFGWNRSTTGREKKSAEHFDEFAGYLTGLQQKGTIQAFDAVILDPHGGDLNGFFLIKGEPAKLDALVSSEAWMTHVTRAVLHLDGAGMIRGVTGDELAGRMALWSRAIAS